MRRARAEGERYLRNIGCGLSRLTLLSAWFIESCRSSATRYGARHSSISTLGRRSVRWACFEACGFGGSDIPAACCKDRTSCVGRPAIWKLRTVYAELVIAVVANIAR